MWYCHKSSGKARKEMLNLGILMGEDLRSSPILKLFSSTFVFVLTAWIALWVIELFDFFSAILMTGHDVRASFQTKQACTATSESKLQSCWYQTEVLPCFLCHPNCCPTTEKAYFQTKHPHFPLEWDLSETGEVCKCALEPIWKHFHCHSNNERPPIHSHPKHKLLSFIHFSIDQYQRIVNTLYCTAASSSVVSCIFKSLINKLFSFLEIF